VAGRYLALLIGNNTVMLDPGGSKTVYLGTNDCVSRVYPAS
jgi:hypothetical protein